MSKSNKAPKPSKTIWTDVKAKGPRYWLFAIAFIATGIVTSNYLNSHYLLLGPRYATYQLLQHAGPREGLYAQRVVFAAVGDDEFWKVERPDRRLPQLDRRIPVKRDYLAQLVTILDAADPEVLAIDYILRSPIADGSLVETPAYAQETEKLIIAIEGTRNSVIVLPETVDEDSYDEHTDSYVLDSNIFGSYQFKNPHVRWGYLNLSRDVRQIPLTVRIGAGKSSIKSFSQQIVATLDPNYQSARRSKATIFGSFMPVDGFITIPAGQVLSDPTGVWRESVKHRAVIIGSFAHKDAYMRGPFIDGILTPVGAVPGAAVHANHVEALLRGRIYPVSPSWASDLAEVLLSLSISVLFARQFVPFKTAGYFVIMLGSAFMLSYFLLQNLAIFFDPVIPVLAVVIHTLGERAFGPHH